MEQIPPFNAQLTFIFGNRKVTGEPDYFLSMSLSKILSMIPSMEIAVTFRVYRNDVGNLYTAISILSKLAKLFLRIG